MPSCSGLLGFVLILKYVLIQFKRWINSYSMSKKCNNIHLMSDNEGNSFVFPRVLMLEKSGLEGKQN